MRKPLLTGMLVVLFGAHAFAAPTGAPVSLKLDLSARERAIVLQAYPQYADGSVRVLTGLTNLNGDKTAEIVAEFDSRGTCTPSHSGCMTVVLAYDGKKWNTVVERLAAEVAVGDVGQDNMRDIIFDNAEVWSWTDAGYLPNDYKMGTPVELKPAQPDDAAALASAFGTDVAAHINSGEATLTVGRADLTPADEDEIVAMLNGSGVCDAETGCPVRILTNKDGALQSVFNGSTTGAVVLRDSTRRGVHDVSVSNAYGFDVYGWNGSSYVKSGSLDIRQDH